MGDVRIPHASRLVAALTFLAVAAVVLQPVAGVDVLDPSPARPEAGAGGAVADAGLKTAADVKLVSPAPDGRARLWPYTSRRRTFESLTLPVNLVVRGPPDSVRQRLQGGAFDEVNRSWQGVAPKAELSPGDAPTWYDTSGATRYTYVEAPGDEGGWMDETAQLQYGTYYGSRYHVRLYGYDSENTSWTAMQAHYEYWDWFRLRHTVTSLDRARKYVESRYFWRNGVTGVSREWYANGGPIDADGWVTVIDFAPESPPTRDGGSGGETFARALGALALAGHLAGRGGDEPGSGGDEPGDDGDGPRGGSGNHVRPDPPDRSWSERLEDAAIAVAGEAAWMVRRGRDSPALPRMVALAVTLVSLPAAVRWAAATAEYSLPWLHIKLVTGVFYLLFVGGITAAVVGLPRGGDDGDWFALASLSLGVGFLLDFAAIQVSVLPVVVVLHRLGVLASVGLLAVGSARRADEDGRNYLLASGVVCWLAMLGWPLFLGL